MIKVISLITIVLSIVFIFLTQDKVKQSKALPKASNTLKAPLGESEKINKYLQEMEFNKKANAIKSGADIDPVSVEVTPDNYGDVLSKDLDTGSGLSREASAPSFQDEVEAEKIRLQSQIEETGELDDAYVQQFIENARKDGLRIKLDKNNQIIDIQKIDE